MVNEACKEFHTNQYRVFGLGLRHSVCEGEGGGRVFDDFVIFVTNDVAVASEFAHQFYFADEVCDQVFIEIVYGLVVEAFAAQAFDLRRVMWNGDDFDRGIEGLAEFFTAGFVDFAVGALSDEGVDVPCVPEGLRELSLVAGLWSLLWGFNGHLNTSIVFEPWVELLIT